MSVGRCPDSHLLSYQRRRSTPARRLGTFISTTISLPAAVLLGGAYDGRGVSPVEMLRSVENVWFNRFNRSVEDSMHCEPWNRGGIFVIVHNSGKF